eukprot:403340804
MSKLPTSGGLTSREHIQNRIDRLKSNINANNVNIQTPILTTMCSTSRDNELLQQIPRKLINSQKREISQINQRCASTMQSKQSEGQSQNKVLLISSGLQSPVIELINTERKIPRNTIDPFYKPSNKKRSKSQLTSSYNKNRRNLLKNQDEIIAKNKFNIDWVLFRDNRETIKQYLIDKVYKEEVIQDLDSSLCKMVDQSLEKFIRNKEFKLNLQKQMNSKNDEIEFKNNSENFNQKPENGMMVEEQNKLLKQAFIKERRYNFPSLLQGSSQKSIDSSNLEPRVKFYEKNKKHRESLGIQNSLNQSQTQNQNHKHSTSIQSNTTLFSQRSLASIVKYNISQKDLHSKNPKFYLQPSQNSTVENSYKNNFRLNSIVFDQSQPLEIFEEGSNNGRTKFINKYKVIKQIKMRQSQSQNFLNRNQYQASQLQSIIKQDKELGIHDEEKLSDYNSRNNQIEQLNQQDKAQVVKKNGIALKLRDYIKKQVKHKSHASKFKDSCTIYNPIQQKLENEKLEQMFSEKDESELLIRKMIENQRELIQKLVKSQQNSKKLQMNTINNKRNTQNRGDSRDSKFIDKNKLFEEFKKEHYGNMRKALKIIESNGDDKVLERHLNEFITLGPGMQNLMSS